MPNDKQNIYFFINEKKYIFTLNDFLARESLKSYLTVLIASVNF